MSTGKLYKPAARKGSRVGDGKRIKKNKGSGRDESDGRVADGRVGSGGGVRWGRVELRGRLVWSGRVGLGEEVG